MYQKHWQQARDNCDFQMKKKYLGSELESPLCVHYKKNPQPSWWQIGAYLCTVVEGGAGGLCGRGVGSGGRRWWGRGWKHIAPGWSCFFSRVYTHDKNRTNINTVKTQERTWIWAGFVLMCAWKTRYVNFPTELAGQERGECANTGVKFASHLTCITDCVWMGAAPLVQFHPDFQCCNVFACVVFLSIYDL